MKLTPSLTRITGCTCGPDGYDFHTGNFSPDCLYHQAAISRPWDHSIPWNCDSYWDGCNCVGWTIMRGPAGILLLHRFNNDTDED